MEGVCRQRIKLYTKDQAESFDDAKGLHESYASQRVTQDKAIRDIQDDNQDSL